jgi:hypothetical protein
MGRGSMRASQLPGASCRNRSESIVVTGATAANTGLTTLTVRALALAFLGTATLWWLHFAEVAENSRRDLLEQYVPEPKPARGR